MNSFMPKFKMEEANEGETGAGASKPEPTPSDKSASNNPPPKEEGDTLDELGYKKIPEEKGEEEPAPKKVKDEKVKDPSTGYGDAPPKVEEDPKPVEKDEQLGFELKLEGLAAEEALKVKEFAKKHKISQEAAQELVDQRKAEAENQKTLMLEAEKSYEREKQKTRHKWYSELKADQSFGGENFAHNIHQVEKFMQEFMPNTKKRLTETKAMLPPYVMRDLANAAAHTYSTEKLVSGEPSKPKHEEESNDPNSFLGEMYR